MKIICLIMLTLLLGSCTQQEQVDIIDRPCTQHTNSYYIGNRAPLLPSAFVKLPVGSIEPQGWLKKYLELQRDGLTGKLGEISAWLEKENNAWLSKNNEGDHGWEEVPYWLKGYSNIAYILDDKAMLAESKIWIEAVLESQRPDGYFGPVGNDLWANMIMLWILQSYYEYSNDERVIPFMTNYFKWQQTVPDEKLLKDYWENSRGGDNLYSIYWLYNITGDEFLLDLAHKIHRNTADWMQKGNLPNWHNVNIAQSFREPATYYLQTHDSAHLQATYDNHFLIRELFGQVPGGMFGGDENCRKGYHDPRQGVETCGMVEQMASDELLVRITGDPFWADHCEEVAFNTYPAAVMPDFKSLRYITSPNMVQADDKNHHPGIDNRGPFLLMNPFSSRCCQHNHTQGWPYYAENLWLATPDNGLLASLYCQSEVTARVGKGETVLIQETTNYPFDENIGFTVNTQSESLFPLYLRIPQWANGAKVSVNGKVISENIPSGKYVRINRTWKSGDRIDLHLPMELGLHTWEANGNSVSVNYGPLTYSLKIKEDYIEKNSAETAIWDSKWQKTANPAEWPSYEILPGAPWNYALKVDKNNLAASFEVVKKPWPASNFPFTIQDVPVEIKAKGALVDGWGLDENGLCAFVPQSPVANTGQLEDISLVPMGAARLRISAFPVIK